MPIHPVIPALRTIAVPVATLLLVAVIQPVTGLNLTTPQAATAAAAAALRADPVPWCADPEKQIDFTNVAVETFWIYENYNGFRTLYKWTPSLCTTLPEGDYCPAGYFIHGDYTATTRCYEMLGDLGAEAPQLLLNDTGVTIRYFTHKSSTPKYAFLEIMCNWTLPPNTIVPTGDVMFRSTSNPYTWQYTFQFQSKCACPGGCHRPTWCQVNQYGIDLTLLPARQSFAISEVTTTSSNSSSSSSSSSSRTSTNATEEQHHHDDDHRPEWTIGLCYALPAVGDCEAGRFITATDPERNRCRRQLGGLGGSQQPGPTSTYDAAKEVITLTYPTTATGSSSSTAVVSIACDRAAGAAPIMVPSGKAVRTVDPRSGAEVVTLTFRSRCACRGGCPH